ncbi:MAG: ribonuclease P protein component [Muribaculaceae bacterium]|nr:ribonuclease P protein component [Muribaculaceae bacterium]
MVNHLFAKSDALYAYPLRMVYRVVDEQEMRSMFKVEMPQDIDKVQFMITVPKKKQRHAVDRVLVRRRIKEAYRLKRLPLRDAVRKVGDKYLMLAFIYQSDKILDYAGIEQRMQKLLTKLQTQLFPTPSEEA